MREFGSETVGRAAFVLVLAALGASGCRPLVEERLWRQSGPVVDEQLGVFDDVMEEFMVEKKVSAGALAVTYHGRLVFAKGYTWAGEGVEQVEPSSLFRIASLSKPITAAAVMHMVDEGKLRLDEKVVEILDMSPPEGQLADPRLEKITILHLLQHLGGWDRSKAFDPMFQDQRISKELGVKIPIRQEDIIKFMNGQLLQHEPGTTCAYSNYGYLLLGRVIEKRSGLSYAEYVQRSVFEPLGIRRMRLGRSALEDRADGEVTYEVPGGTAYKNFNVENMDSHGGWLACAVDLVRFASAFDDPNACPIVSAEGIERMFALPENIEPNEYDAGDRYYACGWNVRDYGDGRRNTWHGGSLPGTFTFMARWSNGVDCVVLLNKRGDGFGQIDGKLGEAAGSIEIWPEGDMFERMLK